MTNPTSEQRAQIEFRCPTCKSAEYMVDESKKKVVCLGRVETKIDIQNILSEKCTESWSKKEAWQAFVVVRRCVSKTDYEWYEGLTGENE